LDEALERIHEALSAGESVIVHCYSGMNRSALTCAAYLIRHIGLSPSDAILHIRSSRPFALSNPAFVEYLLNVKAQAFYEH
jgi:protein-tyrosine phosphatase